MAKEIKKLRHVQCLAACGEEIGPVYSNIWFPTLDQAGVWLTNIRIFFEREKVIAPYIRITSHWWVAPDPPSDDYYMYRRSSKVEFQQLNNRTGPLSDVELARVNKVFTRIRRYLWLTGHKPLRRSLRIANKKV